MLRIHSILLLVLAIASGGCTVCTTQEVGAQPCSEEWFRLVEEKLSTGDGQGHGPDLGSVEWMSVIEFKLGIRGDPRVPPLGGEQWCRFIHENYIENDIQEAAKWTASPPLHNAF